MTDFSVFDLRGAAQKLIDDGVAASAALAAAMQATIDALQAQFDAYKASHPDTPPPPVGDTTAPSVPTGLVATVVSSTVINLAWAASTDAVGVRDYAVLLRGGQIGTSTTPSFSHTGLTPATAYSYSVKARDAAGNMSAASAAVSATTLAVVTPPTGFDPLTLNATNTGAAGTLTNSGGMTTSKDGQVIQNLNVTGRITVQHKNVTIKNCKVTNNEYYAIFAPDDTGHDVSGLTVDHCTISGAINGIAGKGTFNRNNIFKVDNGVNVWGPSLITENYIHDLGSVMSAVSKDGHNDGIENNGSGMTLLRNRIECSNQNDTSACMTNNEFGSLVDILIDGNYLSGGQYTLYCDSRKSTKPVTNFVVTNNTLKKGNYGWTALYDSGVVVGPTNKLI